MLRLAHDVPNIVGVKDAAGNPSETASLIARAPSGFEVYSGDDSFTLPLLAVGAVGVIGVATHWSGVEHGEMIVRVREGRRRRAPARSNARLLESFAFETSDDTPNPIPTKAMMRVLGHAVGQCRPAARPGAGGHRGTGPAGARQPAQGVTSRRLAARG